MNLKKNNVAVFITYTNTLKVPNKVLFFNFKNIPTVANPCYDNYVVSINLSNSDLQ